MGIIQLVLADWPVSIIETASVLVKRKLYTCTYRYILSIFVFLLDRVNTIIKSLKCNLCIHDLSYCRIHFPINMINQMVQRSLWFIVWGGEMVQYEHDWIKDIVHCTSPSLKTLDTMKKTALIEGMLNWQGNAQIALLFVYHMHQRHRRPLSTN